jgi:hypothetical protein
MIERLVVFGDSWTIGYCEDLVRDGLIEYDRELMFGVNFINPWPSALAKMLDVKYKNYALNANDNLNIITQLYDYETFGHVESTDFVVVLLSTWHRISRWNDDWQSHRVFNNRKFFKHTGSRYDFDPAQGDVKDLTDKELNLRSYSAFFNYQTVINFLEKNKLRYLIGWAFSPIDDFASYIDSKYIDKMTSNPYLIEKTFIEMTNLVELSIEKGVLYHPNLEEHRQFANYIRSIIEERYGL